MRTGQATGIFYAGLTTILTILSGFFFSGHAMAGGDENPTVTINTRYILSSDIDEPGPSGEVSETMAGGAFKLPFQISDNFQIEYSVGGHRIFYDWTDSLQFDFSSGMKPWGDLSQSTMGLDFVYDQDKTWFLFTGVNVSAGWEKELNEDALGYGGHVGVMWRADNNMFFSLGVAGGMGPEEGWLFPLFGFSWSQAAPGGPPEGWTVSLGFPQTVVRYGVAEWFAVFWQLGGHMGIYRLDENNPVSPSGLVEMTAFASGLYVEIRPFESLSIAAGVDYVFAREWDIQNKDGNTLHKVDIDGAVSPAVAVTWSF